MRSRLKHQGRTLNRIVFLKNTQTSINFSFESYTTEHTPTELSAGGALLYISNHLTYKPRTKTFTKIFIKKELESIFVEIVYEKRKNLVIGCVYKHPKTCTTILFQKISDDLILVSSNLALSDWNPVCLPLFSTLLRGVECYSQRKQNFVDLARFNRNLSYASSLPLARKSRCYFLTSTFSLFIGYLYLLFA